MRNGFLGSLVIAALLQGTASGSLGGVPDLSELPEIVDDPSDLWVYPATPPWGPRVSDPKTNILWVDFYESAAGFHATVQFVDLSWLPDHGQDVYVSGSIGSARLLFLGVIIPGEERLEVVLCDGTDSCPQIDGTMVVDMFRDQVRFTAAWPGINHVAPGDTFSRPLASSLELFPNGWGYESWAVGDFAPNQEAYGSGVWLLREDRYGRDYIFERGGT